MVAAAIPLLGATWEPDLDKALERAAEEKKAVLVDFTGSDWCTWCIKLRKDVLDTPAFTEYAEPRFVFAEVDVPQNPERAGGVAKVEANRQLCEKFGVRGFPTLLVLSPEGIVVGRLAGYRPMPRLQPGLDAALELSNMLQTARNLQGEEKARALMEVYSRLNPQEGAAITTWIAACDPENTTGIREVRESLSLQSQVDNLLWNATTPADIQAARDLQEKAIAVLPEKLRPRAKEAAEARFANADAMMHRSRSKPSSTASAKIVRKQPQAPQEPTLTAQDRAALSAITQKFQAAGDVDSQIRVLEDALPTATESVQFHVKRSLLNVLMYKLELMGRAARAVGDVYAMRPYMQRVVDLLPPETRPAAQRDLDEKFRNPGQTFIQLKMHYGS